MIPRDIFGGELPLELVSETVEWIDDFILIWEMARRNYFWFKKKLYEVFQLYDVMVFW